MKRIISLITSAALSAAMLSAMAVTSNAETTDLETLAASLGAETDHFSRTGSAYFGETYIVSGNMVYSSPMPYYNAQYAIAVLQTLVHNGIVSASDIKSGAATLSEIEPDEAVNELIKAYTDSVGSKRAEMYFGNIYCHTSQKALADELIEKAEKAMKDGRYFVASIKNQTYPVEHITSSAFATVVIGAADGSWTFDGKAYDKCILTLDPSSSKDLDDSAEIQKIDYKNMGFQEELCIYVDSKTGAFTVPGKHECNDESCDIYFVCDDENILNYKGALAPSEDFGTDTDDLSRVWISNASSLEYTINDKYSGRLGEYPEDMCESYVFASETMFTYYDKVAALHLDTNAGKGAFRGNNSQFLARLFYEDSNIDFICGGAFTADISRKGFSIEKKPVSFTTSKDWINEDNELFNCEFMDDQSILGTSFSGRTKGSAGFEMLDDGYLVKCSDTLKASFSVEGNGIGFTTSEPVMLRKDAADGLFYIYRDGKGDESFSEKVQVGDTNCDGKIDARDASLILSAYADLSGDTNGTSTVSVRYGDFNGDGKLNSADASAVLCSYADMAAK